jgi:hypothetical protein
MAERGILIFGDIASAYLRGSRIPKTRGVNFSDQARRHSAVEQSKSSIFMYFPVHPAAKQAKDPATAPVKRRTGSVKQASGSDLWGTASPEGWRASHYD